MNYTKLRTKFVRPETGLGIYLMDLYNLMDVVGLE